MCEYHDLTEAPDGHEPEAQAVPGNHRLPTLGERRVVHQFNPSGEGMVHAIKELAAELIDYIDGIPQPTGDAARWKAEAMTNIETGAMYAVKAATAGQEVVHHSQRLPPYTGALPSVFPVGDTTAGEP